jgi:magnesium-transporting ATPase (P-type)
VDGVGYVPTGGCVADGDRRFDPAADPGVEELALAALLCNDADVREADGRWIADGDPMEGALVTFALKAGHVADAARAGHPRLDLIPFDARHRFMATLHAGHEEAFACVKGAPEQLVAMCDRQRGLVRVAAALDEPRLDAGRVHGPADRLAAAVDHDHTHPERRHEDDVEEQVSQRVRVLEHAAAELDDGRRVAKAADPAQGLDERVGLMDGLLLGTRGGGLCGHGLWFLGRSGRRDTGPAGNARL